MKRALMRAIGIINIDFQTLALLSGMNLKNYTEKRYELLISNYIKEINQLIGSLPEEEQTECKDLYFTDMDGLKAWLERNEERKK